MTSPIVHRSTGPEPLIASTERLASAEKRLQAVEEACVSLLADAAQFETEARHSQDHRWADVSSGKGHGIGMAVRSIRRALRLREVAP